LGKSVADAMEKIPQLESDIKEAEATESQLVADLAAHQSDRSGAKEDIAKATGIREKEATAFLKESTEDKSNLDALIKALGAIEKGMSSAFLQTNSAGKLRQLSLTQDMSNADRDLLSSFLMGGAKQGYSPASGEIVGILKQMQDTMEKDLAETITAEDGAKSDFEGLVAAKEKMIASATQAIEEKTKRSGETAVQIINLKEDLEDTSESLSEDQKFMADLGATCAQKEKDWAVICKTRQEELIAIADTIKILNDDDAQELFKKSIPSASASFLQVEVTAKQVRVRALKALSSASKNVNMDLILLALHGKKVSFDKVIVMIKDMVALLKKEGVDDENKKTYCEGQFDFADDKKKELELSISDLEKDIEETTDAIVTLTAEIAAFQDGIIKLDREVATATMQRKDEHAEFEGMMASNAAVIQIIGVAKNRLQKFYNPKLYKAPPKKELTEEERIEQNMGGASFLQVLSKVRDVDAPAPPPEAPGAFKKKGAESGGVMAMMDMMKAEVEKETQEAEFADKDAQGEYEAMVKDAATKRAADSKSIAEKEGVKAEMEVELVKSKDTKKVTTDELMATKQYISELHADCDWLLEKFDIRKEARANEIDALNKAVAVLSGADYSLIQLAQ